MWKFARVAFVLCWSLFLVVVVAVLYIAAMYDVIVAYRYLNGQQRKLVKELQQVSVQLADLGYLPDRFFGYQDDEWWPSTEEECAQVAWLNRRFSQLIKRCRLAGISAETLAWFVPEAREYILPSPPTVAGTSKTASLASAR